MKRRTKEILMLLMVGSMTVAGCGGNDSSQEINSQVTEQEESQNTDTQENVSEETAEGETASGFTVADEIKNSKVGELVFQCNDIVIDLRNPLTVGEVFDKLEASDILYMYDTEDKEYTEYGTIGDTGLSCVVANGNDTFAMYYCNFGDTPISQKACRVYGLHASTTYQGPEFLALAGGVYPDGKLTYKDIEEMYSSIEGAEIDNTPGAYVQVSLDNECLRCQEMVYYFEYDDTTGEITGINVHIYDDLYEHSECMDAKKQEFESEQ